jgi:hypothetical protein
MEERVRNVRGHAILASSDAEAASIGGRSPSERSRPWSEQEAFGAPVEPSFRTEYWSVAADRAPLPSTACNGARRSRRYLVVSAGAARAGSAATTILPDARLR